MLEARADEGVGPQSGGPPHDADLFSELLIQDTRGASYLAKGDAAATEVR